MGENFELGKTTLLYLAGVLFVEFAKLWLDRFGAEVTVVTLAAYLQFAKTLVLYT